MLSDKPKLVFTDIAGKQTIEARLHVSLSRKDETSCQQIKQAKQYQPTPQDQFKIALYLCGKSIY